MPTCTGRKPVIVERLPSPFGSVVGSIIGSNMNSHRTIRRFWLTVCFLLLSGPNPILPCVLYAGDDHHAPRVELAESRVDLGTVLEGETLNACFAIGNSGGKPLHIHKVKPGCSCTRVDYPLEIPVAGMKDVCLTIGTSGVHGKRTFKAALNCDDPARPVILLQVSARIQPLVSLTPDRVFFNGFAGQNLKQEILIETRSKKPFSVHIESHDLGDNVAVGLTPVVESKRYRLTVENRRKSLGSYRGRIHLRSDHLGREHIVVPVFAHLIAPVEAYPSQLTLKTGRCPACRGSGRFKGTLIIRANDGKSLEVLFVGPDRTDLNCRIDPLLSGQAYRLHVTTSLPIVPHH
ncbi:DUF1573 domain-containing protein [Desulfosarcina cetonica]|uniref:DUF1573 domain-containing protein n=1 Tax=Desulfosarcina cetonica TaxID=90730 RepID=UPI00278BD964|nr:DUF1573 domain-containing protein [Desulfosarcina cetonica]